MVAGLASKRVAGHAHVERCIVLSVIYFCFARCHSAFSSCAVSYGMTVLAVVRCLLIVAWLHRFILRGIWHKAASV